MSQKKDFFCNDGSQKITSQIGSEIEKSIEGDLSDDEQTDDHPGQSEPRIEFDKNPSEASPEKSEKIRIEFNKATIAVLLIWLLSSIVAIYLLLFFK